MRRWIKQITEKRKRVKTKTIYKNDIFFSHPPSAQGADDRIDDLVHQPDDRRAGLLSNVKDRFINGHLRQNANSKNNDKSVTRRYQKSFGVTHVIFDPPKESKYYDHYDNSGHKSD
jgi:hypothetical protein